MLFNLFSQAVQHRVSKSLLPLHLSACLIGQPSFHSTSFPLNLHTLCFLVDRTDRRTRWTKTTLVTNSYLKTFSCSHKQSATRHLSYSWEQDGQVAQYKCVVMDCDYSAHRVYFSSPAVRDRLIVSKGF